MNFVEFLLGSIPLLLQYYSEMYRETDFKSTMLELASEYNVPKIKIYDFIVVGGGSAGSVLAGRLSEHYNVLLLEAGGTPPPATVVPNFFGDVALNPNINYFFKSVPQTNAFLCCDGVTTTITGKMLGGSGSHNGMVHSRGSPKDYDNWANLLNDDSFNYINVLKYFRRMETFVGDKFGTEEDNEYYGHEGPINVNSSNLAMLDLWLNAGRQLGYSVGDPNGFQRESFAPINVAIRNGKRSSSYAEYIKPYESSRKTLTVLRYATVSEVLLDNDKKAYGVAFSRHGFPQIAYAQKEVILSAGTYSSPLLLMKSGIGPDNILNAAGITTRVALEAVGKNLAEHASYVLTGFSVNDSSLFLSIKSSGTEDYLEQYHNGEGILSSSYDGPQSFIRSSNAELEWPNLWIVMHPSVRVDDEEQPISFYDILARPKSKGTLSLDAIKYKAGIRDDAELALIDYQLLTHPDDMETLLEGIKFIFRIIDTEAMKSINLTYTATPDPSCSAFVFLTDDYWKCKIQRDIRNWHHMVGTCSLGPDSDNSAASVVDTKFRVRGVSNLRVVDASVMPEVTNANINAPVMMLAEKAAEDILNFYNATVSDDTISNKMLGGNGAESTLNEC